MIIPAVTVLMAVHNGVNYLRSTIESVLSQTFDDYEFLIIDDCSTDESATMVRSYSDSRIVLHCNENNLGLTRTLHRGLQLARANFVARIDSDDVMMPNRLAQQINYLRNNAHVGVVGSNFKIIDQNGTVIGNKIMPCQNKHIQWVKYFENPFAHPTTMFNKTYFERHNLNYDAQFKTAQDFDLWTRALLYMHGHNIQMPLTKYRVHNMNVTNKKRAEQLSNHQTIALATINTVPRIFSDYVASDSLRQLIELIITPNIKRANAQGLMEIYFQCYQRYRKSELQNYVNVKEVDSYVTTKVFRVMYTQKVLPYTAFLVKLHQINPSALIDFAKLYFMNAK